MRTSKTQRVNVSPAALRTLHQDGIGWGHDLNTASFTVERLPKRPGRLRSVFDRLKGDLT